MSLGSLNPLVSLTPSLHHLGLSTKQGALPKEDRCVCYLECTELQGASLSWSKTAAQLGWRGASSEEKPFILSVGYHQRSSAKYLMVWKTEEIWRYGVRSKIKVQLGGSGNCSMKWRCMLLSGACWRQFLKRDSKITHNLQTCHLIFSLMWPRF